MEKCNASHPWHAVVVIIKCVMEPVVRRQTGGLTEECEDWCEAASAAHWNPYGT